MTTVIEINHDSSTTIGDFYDNVTDADGAVTVTPVAQLNGSVNGLDVDYDAGVATVDLNDFTGGGVTDIRYRFRIKLDNLTNSNSGFSFQNPLAGC